MGTQVLQLHLSCTSGENKTDETRGIITGNRCYQLLSPFYMPGIIGSFSLKFSTVSGLLSLLIPSQILPRPEIKH